MKGSFFEYHVAVSGLFTARGALNVVGHNMANAAIKGYTRQYAKLQATQPISLGTGRGMMGTGSEMYGIGQIRSFYLDKKYWNHNSTLGEYSSKQVQLSFSQSIFNEMSETGLTYQLNDFFDCLQDLVTNAGDNTYKINVLQQADTISTYIKNTYEALQKQQRDVNTEIAAVVDTINSLGNQIASLNRQITVLEFDGNDANDLRDKRALLIDELSEYINIEVNEYDYEVGGKTMKQLHVMINGQEFIKNNDIRILECRERKDVNGNGLYVNPEDVSGLYDIYFVGSVRKLDVYSESMSGVLKGLVDIRDGNNQNHVETATFSNNFADNPPTVTFTINSNDNRIDLLESGGIARFRSSSGIVSEYRYSDCQVVYTTNADGSISADVELLMEPPMDPNILDTDGFTLAIGKTTSFKGVPYYLGKLNEFVRTFSTAMNDGTDLLGKPLDGVVGHRNGFNGYGEASNDTLFFTYAEGSGQASYPNFNIYKMNGVNFAVNTDLLDDPTKMVTSANSPQASGISDNEVVLGFLKIKSTNKLFREGSLNDYINAITGELGISARQAESFEKNYTEITASVDYQRLSVSAVSLDEEATNMIRLQQQFNAAAKLINVIDAIYDMLINNLGAF